LREKDFNTMIARFELVVQNLVHKCIGNENPRYGNNILAGDFFIINFNSLFHISLLKKGDGV
jgi:hypothetical protein